MRGTRFRLAAGEGGTRLETLEGVVEVFYATSCPQPLILRPDPNGSYRVTLARGAALPPARLESESVSESESGSESGAGAAVDRRDR